VWKREGEEWPSQLSLRLRLRRGQRGAEQKLQLQSALEKSGSSQVERQTTRRRPTNFNIEKKKVTSRPPTTAGRPLPREPRLRSLLLLLEPALPARISPQVRIDGDSYWPDCAGCLAQKISGGAHRGGAFWLATAKLGIRLEFGRNQSWGLKSESLSCWPSLLKA